MSEMIQRLDVFHSVRSLNLYYLKSVLLLLIYLIYFRFTPDRVTISRSL